MSNSCIVVRVSEIIKGITNTLEVQTHFFERRSATSYKTERSASSYTRIQCPLVVDCASGLLKMIGLLTNPPSGP